MSETLDTPRQGLLPGVSKRPPEEKCELWKRQLLDLFPRSNQWREEKRLCRDSSKGGILIAFWTVFFLTELWLERKLERKTDQERGRTYWRISQPGSTRLTGL